MNLWNFLDRFEQWILLTISGIATVAATSGIWLVRKVLTSEKIIGLHEAEFKHRDKLREEDRELREEDRERMARLEEGQDRILATLTRTRR